MFLQDCKTDTCESPKDVPTRLQESSKTKSKTDVSSRLLVKQDWSNGRYLYKTLQDSGMCYSVDGGCCYLTARFKQGSSYKTARVKKDWSKGRYSCKTARDRYEWFSGNCFDSKSQVRLIQWRMFLQDFKSWTGVNWRLKSKQDHKRQPKATQEVHFLQECKRQAKVIRRSTFLQDCKRQVKILQWWMFLKESVR